MKNKSTLDKIIDQQRNAVDNTIAADRPEKTSDELQPNNGIVIDAMEIRPRIEEAEDIVRRLLYYERNTHFDGYEAARDEYAEFERKYPITMKIAMMKITIEEIQRDPMANARIPLRKVN